MNIWRTTEKWRKEAITSEGERWLQNNMKVREDWIQAIFRVAKLAFEWMAHKLSQRFGVEHLVFTIQCQSRGMACVQRDCVLMFWPSFVCLVSVLMLFYRLYKIQRVNLCWYGRNRKLGTNHISPSRQPQAVLPKTFIFLWSTKVWMVWVKNGYQGLSSGAKTAFITWLAMGKLI